MMKKSRYELEKDYSVLKNTYNQLINANIKLVDDNKWLKLENKRLTDNIDLMFSIINDPENKFIEGCYCNVLKAIIEECKYGSTSI